MAIRKATSGFEPLYTAAQAVAPCLTYADCNACEATRVATGILRGVPAA